MRCYLNKRFCFRYIDHKAENPIGYSYTVGKKKEKLIEPKQTEYKLPPSYKEWASSVRPSGGFRYIDRSRK